MSPKHETKDELMETVPENTCSGFLQVRKYRLTQARQKIGTELERKQFWTVEQMAKKTGLSRMTTHRVLKLLHKEKLIHFSNTAGAYFHCHKPFQSKAASSCHSFGVCAKCKAVREFIHDKHPHPHIKGMEVKTKEHEWVTLCTHHEHRH